jgi:hypothetical protein
MAVNDSLDQQEKEKHLGIELIEELSFLNTLFRIIFLVSPPLSTTDHLLHSSHHIIPIDGHA